MISTMYDESTIRAAIIKVMYYNDCRFRFVPFGAVIYEDDRELEFAMQEVAVYINDQCVANKNITIRVCKHAPNGLYEDVGRVRFERDAAADYLDTITSIVKSICELNC